MEMNNNRFFTVETEGRKLFYQVPKQFMLKGSKYYPMTSDSKLLYGILADRNALSIKNNWIDADRRIYFIMTIEELMDLTGWGNQKVIKVMKELRKYELLISKKRGQGKPSLHYLLQVDVEEGLESQSYQHLKKTCENNISSNLNTTSSDMLKSHTNNPYNNNTYNNNTDINKKNSTDKNNIYNNIESEEDNLSCSILLENILSKSNYQEEEEELDQVEPETNQEQVATKQETKQEPKTIVPDDVEYIDDYVKTMLTMDLAFKGLDFSNINCYMPLAEAIAKTRIQDGVDILGEDQWRYFRRTLINKLHAEGIIKNR